MTPFPSRAAESGFSLLELIVVVGITIVVAGMAMLTTTAAVENSRADSAAQAVMRELREARELAISERRNIQVTFVAPGQIEVRRRDVTGTVETGTTLLETVVLEGRAQFNLPAGAPDTPDGFGNAAAVDFGTATALLFTSEGTFVDQTGDPLNGTVFISDPQNDLSLRAVTVFGPTALVSAWRWNGAAWTE
jgi:type II secretory pathway pseudopilin PulG